MKLTLRTDLMVEDLTTSTVTGGRVRGCVRASGKNVVYLWA